MDIAAKKLEHKILPDEWLTATDVSKAFGLRCAHGHPHQLPESAPGNRLWSVCPHGCEEAEEVVADIREALDGVPVNQLDVESTSIPTAEFWTGLGMVTKNP